VSPLYNDVWPKKLVFGKVLDGMEMLLLLPANMPKSIQQKTTAETIMDQWVGSIQVYSYSPDNFYQKRVSGHFTFFVFATFGFASVR
jgi:hypothetical protein